MIGLGLSLAKLSATLGGVIKKGLQMWLGFTKANVLGRELVVNGNFATDSDWTPQANSGWSIANSTAIQSSGTGQLYQEGVITAGKTYSVTVTIDSIASGTSLKVALGSGGSELVFSNVGTTTLTGIAANDVKLYLLGSGSGFSATISNISVKEVAQFTPDKSTNTNEAKLLTGKALEFNGNDYVDLGTTFGLTGEFTVAFFVNLTNYTEAVVVGDGDNEDWFRINSATDYTLKLDNATSAAVVSGGSIPLDTWNRVVLIRDSNDLVTISVNGIIYTDNAPTRAGDFDFIYLGLKDSTRFMSGSLSDVQVYNKAWNSDDAAYDYANPNNLATDNPFTSLTLSNLSAHYALSEGSGNIAFDSTGSGAELITNGDFANGLNGFSTDENASMLNVSDTLQITNTGSYGNVRLSHASTAVDLSYTISVDIKAGSSIEAMVKVGTSAGGSNVFNSTKFSVSNSFETFTFSFNAPSTQSHVSLWNGSAVIGSTVFFDNVSVKLNKADDGTGVFLNTTPAVIGATWVDKQPTIPQLGMMDWSKGSNLVTSSSVYSSSGWTGASGTRSDGGLGLFYLDLAARSIKYESTAKTWNRLVAYGTPTVNGSTYSSKFYIKCTNVPYAHIYIGPVANHYIVIDVVGESVHSGSASVSNLSVVFLLEGWISISYTFTANGANNQLIASYFSTNTIYHTGIDVGATVLMVKPQQEIASTVGSYIATSGFPALNATLIQNPNDIGKDVLGNSLRLRDGGFNLDGIGYAEVDSSSSLNIANYSIDGWIYATNTTSSHQSILTKHTQDNYQLYVRNSQIKLFNSTNGETLLASINLNVWNYFCITESEGVIKFYLNNGSAQSIGTVSQKLATNGKLYIGSHQSADFWKGLIDDVRLYNGILSDKEVLNNYKIGLSKHS